MPYFLLEWAMAMVWLESRLTGWLTSLLSCTAEYRFFITLSAAVMDSGSAGLLLAAGAAELPDCWQGLASPAAAVIHATLYQYLKICGYRGIEGLVALSGHPDQLR